MKYGVVFICFMTVCQCVTHHYLDDTEVSCFVKSPPGVMM